MICRTCEKHVPRIRGVKDDGTFFYIDGFGRRWNGRQCPVCHTKENTHRKREAEALEYLRGCGWVCVRKSQPSGGVQSPPPDNIHDRIAAALARVEGEGK